MRKYIYIKVQIPQNPNVSFTYYYIDLPAVEICSAYCTFFLNILAKSTNQQVRQSQFQSNIGKKIKKGQTGTRLEDTFFSKENYLTPILLTWWIEFSNSNPASRNNIPDRGVVHFSRIYSSVKFIYFILSTRVIFRSIVHK